MIPAKIIEINDKVIVKYGETISEAENYIIKGKFIIIERKKRWRNSDDVSYITKLHELKLNQTVFIEPTTEGNCKIIKIK
jgi:hypothetical protein